MSNEFKVGVKLHVDSTQYTAEFTKAGHTAQAFAAQVSGSASSAATGIQSITGKLDGLGHAATNGNTAAAAIDRITQSGRQAAGALGAIPQPLTGAAAHFQAAQTGLAGVARQGDAVKTALSGGTPAAHALGAAAASASQQAAKAGGVAQAALGQTTLSAKQTAAALRGVPAQFTDIITSIQGGQAPLTVFLQQGGQLKDMFGGAGPAARALGGYVAGLVNPFTAAAAVVGVLALGYYKGSQEADGYRAAILMSGNAAGTTVGQLTDMARAISEVTGTQGAAAAALTEMAGSGAVARENLQQFAQTAMGLDKYVGQPVKATVDHLEQLGKAPLQASVKLNEQYHHLTVAVYEQIRALEEQGRKEEAGAAAQQAYMAAMEARKNEMAANLGSIERAWNAVTGAAKGAWDAMLNVGRPDTLSTEIANVRQKIDQAKGLDPNRRHSMPWDTPLAELEQQLANLTEQERMLRRGAEAQAARARQAEHEAEWGKIITANKSKEKQQEDEILRIRNAGKAADKEQLEIEREISAYKARVADKGTSGVASRELERQRSLLAELAGLSGDFYKEWESLTKQFQQGKISQEDLVRLQSVLLAKQPAMVAAAKEEQHLLEQRARAWQEIQRTQERAQQQALEALQRGAKAAEQQVQRLQEEEAAASLAASANIPLAEAVERVALARAEDNYQKALGQAADGATLLALQKEIDARREIVGLVRSKETREGIKKTADEAEKELKRITEQYEQGLTNAAMQGGKSLREYIHGMLRTTAFRIVLQPVMAPLAGLLASVTGSGGAAASQGSGLVDAFNGLSAVKNAYGFYQNGIGSLTAPGSMYYNFATSGIGQSMGLSNAAPIIGNNPSAYMPAGTALQTPGWMGQLGTAGGVFTAITALAAAFGAFTKEVSVGGGYSGTFGAGDITGYDLRRESGTLFGGPDYTMVNPRQRIAELEAMRGTGKYLGGGWAGADAALEQEIERLKVTYKDMMGDMDNQSKALQTAYEALRTNAGDMADSLGLGSDAVRKFTTTVGTDVIHPDTGGIGIKLDGLKPEEVQAKIQAALATASNELAQQVIGSWETVTETVRNFAYEGFAFEDGQRLVETAPTVTQKSVYVASEFAKDGEKAIDTLSRLSTSITSVNGFFANMGSTLYEASMVSADMASQLLEQFGGMDNFAAVAGRYYETFYSDTERIDSLTRSLTEAFRALGFELPKSQAQLRALIDAQDRMTASGREQYASLMGLSSALDELHSSANAARSALHSAVGNVATSIATMRQNAERAGAGVNTAHTAIADAYAASQGKVADAQATLADLMEQSSDATRSFAGTLTDYLASLRTGTQSGLDPATRKQMLAAELQSTAVLAQGGDAASRDKLTGVASAYLDAARAMAGSDLEYAREVARVRTTLQDVAASLPAVGEAAAGQSLEQQIAQATEAVAAAQAEQARYAQLAADTGTSILASTDLVGDEIAKLRAAYDAATAEQAAANIRLEVALAALDALGLSESLVQALAAGQTGASPGDFAVALGVSDDVILQLQGALGLSDADLESLSQALNVSVAPQVYEALGQALGVPTDLTAALSVALGAPAALMESLAASLGLSPIQMQALQGVLGIDADTAVALQAALGVDPAQRAAWATALGVDASQMLPLATALGWDADRAALLGTAIGMAQKTVEAMHAMRTLVGFSGDALATVDALREQIGISPFARGIIDALAGSMGLDAAALDTIGTLGAAVGFAGAAVDQAAALGTAVGFADAAVDQAAALGTAVGFADAATGQAAALGTAVGFSAVAIDQTAALGTALGMNGATLGTIAVLGTAVGFADAAVDQAAALGTAVGFADAAIGQAAALGTAVGLQSHMLGTLGQALGLSEDARKAIAALSSGGPSQVDTAVQNAYAMIGRTGIGSAVNQVDQGGFDYWRGQLVNGRVTMEQFLPAFLQSAATHVREDAGGEYAKHVSPYLKQLQVPGFDVGSNYIPRDMIAMVHEGERIFTAADNRQVLDILQRGANSGNNAELLAELRALRAEVERQRTQLEAIRKATQGTDDTLATVTRRGRAMQTETFA